MLPEMSTTEATTTEISKIELDAALALHQASEKLSEAAQAYQTLHSLGDDRAETRRMILSGMRRYADGLIEELTLNQPLETHRA